MSVLSSSSVVLVKVKKFLEALASLYNCYNHNLYNYNNYKELSNVINNYYCIIIMLVEICILYRSYFY